MKWIFLVLTAPLYLSAALIPVSLEHAVTQQQKKQGLMERTSLPDDGGMLFHYNPPTRISIWMFNTKIDLSLAYLNQDGIIKEIHELKSYPDVKEPSFFLEKAVTASVPVSYALEMSSRWFTKHGVKVGDQLIWDSQSPKAYIKTND